MWSRLRSSRLTHLQQILRAPHRQQWGDPAPLWPLHAEGSQTPSPVYREILASAGEAPAGEDPSLVSREILEAPAREGSHEVRHELDSSEDEEDGEIGVETQASGEAAVSERPEELCEEFLEVLGETEGGGGAKVT